MRERHAGMYYSSAYFMAKFITEVAMQFLYPILFSCIVYFLIGFRLSASAFFTFLGFLELCLFTANSIAMLISSVAGNVLLSAGNTVIVLLLYSLMCVMCRCCIRSCV
jgi:ATP-binding cassette subfamily G (WHITE) protein 2